MAHNVPVVTYVLVAGWENAKAKNTILTPILRLQATKMWRRQNTTKGKPDWGFAKPEPPLVGGAAVTILLGEVGT
jgi:hypothetical protein